MYFQTTQPTLRCCLRQTPPKDRHRRARAVPENTNWREHRQAGAAAAARMQSRGETLAAIAELAGVKVSDAHGAEIRGRTTGRAG